MITFKISGALPSTWEDFLSLVPGIPSVTIYTAAEFAECGGGTDGWLDVVVDVDAIDEDVARLGIADALGLSNPEEIAILQLGVCRAI